MLRLQQLFWHFYQLISSPRGGDQVLLNYTSLGPHVLDVEDDLKFYHIFYLIIFKMIFYFKPGITSHLRPGHVCQLFITLTKIIEAKNLEKEMVSFGSWVCKLQSKITCLS